MRNRETPLSHVLFVMALGFALLVAINLLGCDREHEATELSMYPHKVPGHNMYPTGIDKDGEVIAWETLPPDREREVLLRENEELHYNNMIRARIIEELMERVDRCEEKP